MTGPTCSIASPNSSRKCSCLQKKKKSGPRERENIRKLSATYGGRYGGGHHDLPDYATLKRVHYGPRTPSRNLHAARLRGQGKRSNRTYVLKDDRD